MLVMAVLDAEAFAQVLAVVAVASMCEAAEVVVAPHSTRAVRPCQARAYARDQNVQRRLSTSSGMEILHE